MRYLADLEPDRLMLFTRHAECEKNRLGYHGHTERLDHPLTSDGERDTHMLAQALCKVIRFRSVISSPSRSGRETSAALGDRQQIPVAIRPGLRSVGMGIIADLTIDEIRGQYPVIFGQLQEFEAGRLHPKDLALPGGEQFFAFAERVHSELNVLVSQQAPVLVVTHYSTLTMLVHLLSVGDRDRTAIPYAKHSFPHLSLTLAVRLDGPITPSTWSVQFVGLPWRSAVRQR